MNNADYDEDHGLMERFGAADPTLVDEPPAPGSPRFISIKDGAMRTMHDPQPAATAAQQLIDPISPEPRPARRRLVVAIAATIAALAVALVGFTLVGSTPDAAAAVHSAAANTAEVTSFRALIETEGHTFIPGGIAHGEADGTSIRMVVGDLEYIRIGDTEWTGSGGAYRTAPAEDAMDPFAQASAAVIDAALESNLVVNAGTDDVEGVETVHYVIELDDASRAALLDVPTSSQWWFVGDVDEEVNAQLGDEEGQARRSGFLEDADTIDVWVANDLVHRISVTDSVGTFTYTFYDFGGDVVIEAPQ